MPPSLLRTCLLAAATLHTSYLSRVPKWIRPRFDLAASGPRLRSPRARSRHRLRTEAVRVAFALHVVVIFLHDGFCEAAVLRRRWRPPAHFADICLSAARRLARLPKLICGGRGTLDALLSDVLEQVKGWQP